MTRKKVRIAALADTHVGKSLPDTLDYSLLFADISKNADIFLLGGDLTDHGTLEEANKLVGYLQNFPIPIVAVLGNHDVTSGKEDQIRSLLRQHRIKILGVEVFQIGSVGFAGVKGFGGGYGNHTLGAFGEHVMKQFIQETINEAETLEIALDNLGQVTHKIVLLHYSPILATNIGEPLEIYPFLGSSRLEEVIDRHDVTAVFHGHAHFGSHTGQTLKGIPVFNVAYPLMQKISPHQPYKIFEI